MKNGRNYDSKVVAVATTETEVVARNNDRKALILFNTGSEAINLYMDDATTATFALEAGKGMYFEYAPINQVNATVASGTVNLTVLEA